MTPSYDRYLDHLIDQYTSTDDAELARDEAFATWCDEHNDATRDAIDAAGEVAL